MSNFRTAPTLDNSAPFNVLDGHYNLGQLSTLYDEADFDSLLHYWPLDSDPNDDVGSKDFTVEGATTTTGAHNGAYAFDGVDDRLINTNVSGLPTDEITISCWINFASTSGDQIAFVHSRSNSNSFENWSLGYSDVNDALTGIITVDGSTVVRVGSSPSTGTAYHLALTYDGSTIKFYEDGTQVGSSSQTGPISYNGDELALGQRIRDGTFYEFNWIDEPMIFSKALSSSRINLLYEIQNSNL